VDLKQRIDFLAYFADSFASLRLRILIAEHRHVSVFVSTGAGRTAFHGITSHP
jgi:hypothetical protein